MATTVTPSTLTVTHTEAINLNGQSFGATTTKTIDSIQNINKSIISVGTTECGIVGVSADIHTDLGKSYLAGQYDEDVVRYIRITNLDNANYVFLTFRNSGNTNANEVAIKLDKGCSYIYGVDVDTGTEATIQSNTSALSIAHSATLDNLIDIVGIANSATCHLEVFVATT